MSGVSQDGRPFEPGDPVWAHGRKAVVADHPKFVETPHGDLVEMILVEYPRGGRHWHFASDVRARS